MAYASAVGLILTILLAVFGLLVPWILALALRVRSIGTAVFVGRMGWQPIVHSMLAYILAFNIIFFIQELFLVLPKAFTPGLRPTLFHNNHRWDGEHPLASLFQGTGALTYLTDVAGSFSTSGVVRAPGSPRRAIRMSRHCEKSAPVT